MVVDGGRLFWIQDAYTTSSRYPYSEPVQGQLNYIRNSVKIVIDAYLGDMTFYIADSEDLLVRTYARIFPKLFRPLSAMPKGLRSHMRYPEDLFDIQRQVICTYHMRDPRVFYNKEDVWQIPTEIYRGSDQVMESYYTIMSLPHAVKEEFVLLIPFTPSNKNNMIAWLAARSDGLKLRPSDPLPVPEKGTDLRAHANRGAHRPGPEHFTAHHAVESERLQCHQRQPARHSDRELGPVRRAHVPAGGKEQDSRADPYHRGLREPSDDGRGSG